MSFQDLTTEHDAYLMTAPGAEVIEYREVATPTTGAWSNVHAIVIEGNDEQDRVIGQRGHYGQEPLRVHLFKAEVASIREQKDEIRRSGKIYTINSVLQEGPSWWVCYCCFRATSP